MDDCTALNILDEVIVYLGTIKTNDDIFDNNRALHKACDNLFMFRDDWMSNNHPLDRHRILVENSLGTLIEVGNGVNILHIREAEEDLLKLRSELR